jgi:hypothetical protein
MTLLLTLLVLAAGLTALAVLRRRGARPRGATFRRDDPGADVSRARAHLDAVARTGQSDRGAAPRVHLSGVWTHDAGHPDPRHGYAKGFKR